MRLAPFLAIVLLLAACGAGDEPTSAGRQGSGPATLLFASTGENGSWDVQVEDVASGERTNLSRTPSRGRVESDDRSPALSPDGTQVAYTSTADHVSDGAVDEEIFVMEADGSEPRRLTNDADADGQPQWTPDGRIAFTTCPSSQDAVPDCRLDVISPDGSRRETLGSDLGLASGVALSRDGERIVYPRVDETLRSLGLFVRELGSQEERRVGDGGGAQWSPDGERIAFLTARDGNGRCLFRECSGPAAELYVADADGSNERRLTETAATEGFAAWTPDGGWILFSRIRDEEDDYDIYAVRADGSCEVRSRTRWCGSGRPRGAARPIR